MKVVVLCHEGHTDALGTLACVSEAVSCDPKEYDRRKPSILEIRVTPNKQGLLALLRKYAIEPNNG